MFGLFTSHEITEGFAVPTESEGDLRGCEVMATDGQVVGLITEVYGSLASDMLSHVEVMTQGEPTKVLMLPFELLQWEQNGQLKFRGDATKILATEAYQEENVWRNLGRSLITYDEMIRQALLTDRHSYDVAS